MPAPVALTGVPGTGKSTTASLLAPRIRSVEVGDLAIAWGLARRSAGALTVDLGKMQRRFRQSPPGVDLVVGHLAHLLPMRDVIVLRCHPEQLVSRLARTGRGSARERHENYVAEALDVVLAEAVRPGRRVWEIDTTDRTPRGVGRSVARLLRLRPPSRYGRVDWLAERRVAAHLLEPEG
jgi:adenylate kinase